MPSTRYAEIAPKVRDVCKRYGLPYNTGPFLQQWGMVQRTILRLAFPGGKVRPKPGPYQGTDTVPGPAASNGGASAASNGERVGGVQWFLGLEAGGDGERPGRGARRRRKRVAHAPGRIRTCGLRSGGDRSIP